MAYDGTITIGLDLDDKEFDAQILQLERKINDMERDLQVSISTGEFKEDSEQAEELRSKIEKAKNQLVNLRKQKEKYNSTGYTSKGLDSLDVSLGSALKKIGRIVLAVFSVRTAFSALSRASSTLAQYNDEYATNLEYIRYVIAQTLAPILEWVVQLVATLMGYINYIAKALFNVTLFSDKSAKNFASARKSTSQMKKDLQTTPFDEMNVLSDSSTSGGSVGGGVPTISFEDVQIPEWMQKIVEVLKPIVDWFKEIIDKYGLVKVGIVAVVTALAGFLILKLIAKLIKSFTKSATGVTTLFDSLGKAAEAIAIFGGIALVLKEVIDLIKTFDESGLELGDVAALLGIVLGELAAAFVIMAAASKMMDWQSMAGAAVILGGLAIVINQVTGLITALGESGLEMSDILVAMGGIFTIVTAAMAAMAAIAMVLASNPLALIGVLALVTAISTILIVVKETLPTILEAVGKFINNVAPPLIKVIKTIFNGVEKIIIALGRTLPPIIYSIGSLFSSIFNGIQGVIRSIGDVIVNILNAIAGLVDSVFGSVINFIYDLGPAINNFVDNTIWAVTKLVNFVVSAIEYLVNRVVDGINGIADVLNVIPGINIKHKQYVNIPRFRPRLAVGGIINNPGRGVPIGGGSAIGGEAGREGVIPLTDSQAMEMLGKAIGRYITINANITNSMNGRVISRQLQKIQNDNAFAYNA